MMLRGLNQIRKHTIVARDGEIGSLRDFLFDDREWVVRYMVVNTGPWLFGREVLLSPAAVKSIDHENGRIMLDLSQEQIRNSPDVETRQPISREAEQRLVTYYSWPLYWTGFGMMPEPMGVPTATGMAPAGISMRPVVASNEEGGTATMEAEPSLRSAKDVSGYYIEAMDGTMGHVADFIFDDDTWAIRYLAIDTRNWWPGKHVLVSPHWVRDISWDNASVYMDLSRDEIKDSPQYDPEKPITRDYETRLHEHYGRPRYWE